ncbi:hypothetical protein A3K34_02700 [candidate division WWE3 bacterium RIFOXYC1_FULL_40_10]|uniref:SMP-30/Gluconolactonase/LRE-like region domain-containing protein n=1 Tax=candidate division WWE3 bacterium RIFOXYA2_FULL_46_9 TaxID=1802636 RepID=A0A1F4W379_UNCKA|nr:MAG: hypothetical protein A3K58_02700 [candidate division WWE3 bacterium RIFOXYB1_FULL_40_22]OGC61755.1 MAG: hypothetical protein A3K37_02700 [candidate division WWE3 bacterium RIFOXYA1_FULL_40_11]OGC63738.1 MAG: hypothetical protein A2264_05190 [candidate division WWE3 bacterium RIFOXYA2_FULL_46_9]OGC65195.1 MAG: hypothetical protein A2326_02450 [candidate division WWE3 bacterium RIFOXYB2_FULL_41_6]OGC66138.1 MAG: hypothetical protein A3K34_02700 [candidate division WWE3 bacterium RIFOXYC1_
MCPKRFLLFGLIASFFSSLAFAADSDLPAYERTTPSSIPNTTQVYLYAPRDIVFDSDGNIFISDASNHRLVKITSDQTITTFGSQGATHGKFNFPHGLFLDSSDKLYVVDTTNKRVEKYSSSLVYEMTFGSAGTGDGQFSSPGDVVVDSAGYVYVTDIVLNRVMKFEPDGDYSAKWGTTGSGNGQFSSPGRMAIDSDDKIYVSDYSNSRVQRFTSSGVHELSIGSYGTGDGELVYSLGVAVDEDDNIYISEGGARVQKFNSSGVYQSKWGTLGNSNGDHESAYSIVLNGGYLYMVDNTINRVTKFTLAGGFVYKWGLMGGENGEFYNPAGACLDGNDTLYVSDGETHRVQKFDGAGNFISTWGSEGSGDGQFSYPQGCFFYDNKIFVTDMSNDRVQVFDTSGNYLSQWGSSGAGNGQFNGPIGIVVSPTGRVYVSDSNNNRVQEFTTAGVYVNKFGESGSGDGQLDTPYNLGMDGYGHIYVADTYNNRIQKFTAGGVYISQWDHSGGMDEPQDVDVYGSYVYVTDTYNHMIKKFTLSGTYLAGWGALGSSTSQFNYPYATAITSSGNIYVVDTFNNRILYYEYPAVSGGDDDEEDEDDEDDNFSKGKLVINSSDGTIDGSSATTTKSPYIRLYLRASGDVAKVEQMKISTKSDLSEASWESYRTTKDYKLPDVLAGYTVYVRFKDTKGNVSDKISRGINYTGDSVPALVIVPELPRIEVEVTEPPVEIFPKGDVQQPKPHIGKPMGNILALSAEKLVGFFTSLGVGISTAALSVSPLLFTGLLSSLSTIPYINPWALPSLISGFFRKKDHPWGVVYDSKNKQPLDPVVLTLTSAAGKVIQTVTDMYGRYQFLVEPGTYTISARKTSYLFPSAKITSQLVEPVYSDILTATEVVVPTSGKLDLNIPMDALASNWNQLEKIRRGIGGTNPVFAFVTTIAYYAGLVWSIVVITKSPTPTNIFISIIFLLLFIYRTLEAYVKSWGVIKNHAGKFVPGCIVRLVNSVAPEFRGQVSVADYKGRYNFLVEKGNYQIRVDSQPALGVIKSFISSTIPIKKAFGRIGRDLKL